MPLSSPMFDAELKVPKRASIPASTIPTMMLKSTKYQYSLRLDLPLNTVYFFNASRYQLNSKSPHLSVRAFRPFGKDIVACCSVPNFSDRRIGEVLRITLPGTRVNKGMKKGRSPILDPDPAPKAL